MKAKYFFSITLLLFVSISIYSQPKLSDAKGNLFIIGGGGKSIELIKSLIATSKLSKTDYIVILPMSTAEPDSSYYFIKKDLEKHTPNIIANLNFTKDNVSDNKWLDSLKKAKLIYITGGDQSRFMGIILNTPVVDAIHYAYQKGATIAGTSAGAAVMSKKMITGKELSGDTSSTAFKKIHAGNIDLQVGLGLLDSVIIDQHFIVRSRFNRLLTAIAMYPSYTCIGIDESTAIIVQGKKITVVGESQVVVLSDPKKLAVSKKLVKVNDLRFSLYTAGDSFQIR